MADEPSNLRTVGANSVPSSTPTSRPFPTKRTSWSELKQIILQDNDLARLRRCQKDQQTYDDYMTKVVKTHYKSVMDFILDSKLDVPTQIDPSSGKKYAMIEKVTNERKCLVRNDFPYYFDTAVDHWILWKLGGSGEISASEIDEAKMDLNQQLGDVVDFLHWINPPALKSIPEIDHVHILCLRKGEAST